MRALLAVALLLVVVPAAHARSYSVAAAVPESDLGVFEHTLALADGQVLWLEPRGDGAALMAAGEDAAPRELTSLAAVPGPRRFHTVFASGTTAFAQRLVCRNKNCTRTVRDVLRVDLATSATAPFDACLGHDGCRRCPDGRRFALAFRGSVLASDGLCDRTDVVTDFADGATRTLPDHVTAVAGRFAVRVVEGGTSTRLLVLDWRTGAEVSRVPRASLIPPDRRVALDDDGTIAWVEHRGVLVLSPGAKRPRRALPLGSGDFTEAKLAGGKLAVRDTDALGGNELRVAGRQFDAQHGRFGWAFDGTRAAWVAQPCAKTVVQVWDLATDPPPPAADRCTRAEPVAVTYRPNALRVRLTCPPDSALGCAGDVAADLYAGARKLVATAWSAYRIPSGGTRTERIPIESRLSQRPRVARVKVDTGRFDVVAKRLRVRR